MSGTLSTRWFWSDWMSDPGLRACGYAARGLWKDLLCIAGSNKKEYGFVTLNGKKLDSRQIAQMTNGTVDEVDVLLAELQTNGVFNRDRRGAIYCRRMVRAEKSRRNGRLGGNPNILKDKDNKNQVGVDPNPPIPKPITKTQEQDSLFPTGNNAPPEAPLDARTKLFREGLATLQRLTGKTRDGTARIISKWLRDALDDALLVNRMIEDAERDRVLDPVAWITKAISHRMRGTHGTDRKGARLYPGQISAELRARNSSRSAQTVETGQRTDFIRSVR